MPRRALPESRQWGVVAAVALLASLAASELLAATPPRRLAGVLSCAQRASKGRVPCEAELEVSSARIEWADLVVLEAPAFAPPLRSRVDQAEAVRRTPERIRLPLSLAAKGTGRGQLRVRARAVICIDASSCSTESRELVAVVLVGPET